MQKCFHIALVYMLHRYNPIKSSSKIFLQSISGWSSEVCLQPLETGSCKGYFPRWFYNTTSNRCEVFIYGGCNGNQNRFETREKCENACGCGEFTTTNTPVCIQFMNFPVKNLVIIGYNRSLHSSARQWTL